MQLNKDRGRVSAVRKYDVITALGAFALSGSKHDQRLTLRFITLITARYNWPRELLAVGQREIAALWSVDERTVKREMSKLRSLGWLVVKRQGARGRVTEYRMDQTAIERSTKGCWKRVGPDFDVRMRGDADIPHVIPMPLKGENAPPPVPDGTYWSLVKAVLHEQDAGSYASWIAALTEENRAGSRLVLRAPSRFHAAYVQTHLMQRLMSACDVVGDEIDEIVLMG